MGRRLCNPLPPGDPPPQSYVAPVSPEDYLEKGYSLHTMGVFYCGPGRELQTTLSAQWALPLLLFFTQTLFYYILTPPPLGPPPLSLSSCSPLLPWADEGLFTWGNQRKGATAMIAGE